MSDRRQNPTTTRRPAGDGDPRELPNYTLGEAAHYLQLPRATLRSWIAGRTYPIERGRRRKRFEPLITPPQSGPLLLSFHNLVEAHVLAALRREHRVRLPQIRQAMSFLRSHYGSKRPLIDREFVTDGVKLFVQELGKLIDASSHGQTVIREILEAHLKRVERDARGGIVRLYPFTRLSQLDSPKFVVIDPRISFGRPSLTGTRIPTAAIAERYKAGESIGELARDYGREALEIEEAVRCELATAA